jgi:hypothetical protein
VTGLGPLDDSSDPAEGHLGSVMGKIDERAGDAEYEDQGTGSCEITDHDPVPDSIDRVGDDLCSEIAHGTRIARLVLHEALSRVSDAMAAQTLHGLTTPGEMRPGRCSQL